jgi:hypothetical protein
MSTRRGYILIALPPATPPEACDASWSALAEVGSQDYPQPNRCNHGRLSLDGSMLLLEGEFDVAEVEPVALVGKCVPDTTVTLLGGAGCTYEESHAAALQYLSEHVAEWEEDAQDAISPESRQKGRAGEQVRQVGNAQELQRP